MFNYNKSQLTVLALSLITITGVLAISLSSFVFAADPDITEKPDGTTISTYENGTIITTFTNGTIQTEHTRVWIWTFSRLDDSYWKNDCFLEAVKLAETIAKSAKGQNAYKIVNKPNTALTKAEVDKTNLHPEFDVKTPTGLQKQGAFAWYDGDSGGKKDSITFNKQKLDKALQNCNTAKKKDSIIIIATAIVHETAHWKDDNIKFPKSHGDTRGEEGVKVIRAIFGGELDVDEDGNLTSDGKKVNDATKTSWSNPSTWSP